jgi:hypothetical protein
MFKRTATGLLIALATTHVMAQSQKPGLWEITHKTGGNAEMDAAMAQMQKQMASMSPAQRKQMEAMMAQHGGSMPTAAAGGGMSMKVCISPEMAARDQMPQQTEGDCTTSITSRTAGSMKMAFVCTNPPSKGEGTYTFPNDKAYTMAMTIRSERKGKPDTVTLEGSGKWLTADCGTVKPMEIPKTKGK